MKKVKRFLALFLCVIGCLALVACGSDDKNSSKPNTNQDENLGDDIEKDIYD